MRYPAYGPRTAAEETAVKQLIALAAEYRQANETAEAIVSYVRNVCPVSVKWDVPTLLDWARQALTEAPRPA